MKANSRSVWIVANALVFFWQLAAVIANVRWMQIIGIAIVWLLLAQYVFAYAVVDMRKRCQQLPKPVPNWARWGVDICTLAVFAYAEWRVTMAAVIASNLFENLIYDSGKEEM